MELARGREYGVFDRAIDVQVSRLRKLVEDDPAKPRYIQTVWGFGYVFVPDGQKAATDAEAGAAGGSDAEGS
jgi:two-component system phosphate regulon response regulator OmpR